MQYFNFARLVHKYNSELTVIVPSTGNYDDRGILVKGETQKVTLQGAVINHTESKIYRAEGKLTAMDKRLFTLEPIKEALLGAKVIYDNKVFSIDNNVENSKFTGVYAYTLKYVSAFDKEEYE